jgi:hypothetical protein
MPVIVHGNPCDGISIIGPFKSPRDAERWAEANLDRSDGDHFWSTPLYSPDEFLSNKTEQVRPNVDANQAGRRRKSEDLGNNGFFAGGQRQSGRLPRRFPFSWFRLANST